ncbi:HPP family protein [Halopelagius fulvigenes]|uniref:HPP family protein n=1 Tax=Halopelagius fulvigenes TaxID=1198324 RepID=A0ABD5U403_9EURY
MNRRRMGTSLYAGVLFSILGLVGWVSGHPFIFPSLGPSAFILAFERRGERTRTYRIVGGHLIGGVCGLFAYWLLAAGTVLTTSPPGLSLEGLRLAASGFLSVVLTSWGMIATDTKHAPACATTLIVSLGLLSSLTEVAIIVASVVILVETHLGVLWAFERIVGDIPEPSAAGDEAESTE